MIDVRVRVFSNEITCRFCVNKMDPAELDVVQFGKIARATGQHGKDVMWRAVVRSEEKLRTPVFEFQRCHVVDVREHADGTFTTVVRMDDASVAQLLELEDKAVERLGGLGAGGAVEIDQRPEAVGLAADDGDHQR